MGLLKSISKSMKGTFVGDLAKSADKPLMQQVLLLAIVLMKLLMRFVIVLNL